MPRIEPELQRLQDIKSLPSLIKYLKTDLNWPIESDDVEDVTFDYDPAELGFDTASTAKIEEVRQLRPLTHGQKWGIFWVKFGKKQLPVQMLRRALGNLVVKKRASTKKSDKAAWHMHDLLFISAYGDDSNRHITFAHFSESEDSEKSLPVLKVLGWDDDDTVLHLKDTYKTLLDTLNWDTTPINDPEAWRNHWSSAFRMGHREVINTTKELVVELAQLATVIKKSVLTTIKAETERGPWTKLMLAFQKTLIKDLDEEQFADVIAQTISYGLLTARLSSDGPISLKNLVDMVPATNPFLKELLQHFLTSAGMKGLFDVDEAGINDVVELLNRANAQAIRNDFGKKTAGEDPVIHFYEHFLGAYNKKLKVERGVFYTPQPVVSYIVRSVHEILQKEFGLEDGLADTSTWAEVQKRYKNLKIPEGIKDPKIEPFVQILDPATGTATFLIEVIEVIHNTMTAKWDKERISKSDQIKKWNTYVPIHLLPRLYAYELMMAPYAIAHMKVGLKLGETGFTSWDKLGSESRANIFLTNALEPCAKQLDLPGFDALAREAAAVNEIKRHKRFSVVIGNPPYSILSQNLTEGSRAIVDVYKSVQGVPIKERGALQFEKLLQDDYVKFLRLSEIQIENTGVGVNGLITNHSFVDNPTMRGVRDHLMATFPSLSVLDLHGNSLKGERCPDGSDDRNVFDIKQGVAILIGLRGGPTHKCSIRHSDLWGERSSKYSFLASQSVASTPFTPVRPTQPYFLFTSQDENLVQEFQSFPAISEMMPQYSAGVITARDNLAIDESEAELLQRAEAFRRSTATNESLCEQLDISLKKGWDISTARQRLRGEKDIHRFVQPIVYRAFDTRRIFYHPSIVWGMAFPTMKHMLSGKNIGIITVRRVPSNADCSYFFVSRSLISNGAIRMDNQSVDTIFPLFLTADKDGHQGEFDYGGKFNFSDDFVSRLAAMLGLSVTPETSLPTGLTPEDIFHYAYAVFHSPGYRSRYAEFLKIDFPRLPLTGNLELFRTLAQLGGELTALHLLESPKLAQPITEFIAVRNPEIEKVSWSRDTVWVDKAQTAGFCGVSELVWNFHIGGYQVCEKWLKDRKGRKLSKDDIAHYHKIVVALSETIRLMVEIDKVIDEHGGWPGAFTSSKS